MRFHVWPRYFVEAADMVIHRRFESLIFFCISLVFGICSRIFEQNSFGLLFLLSFFFAIFSLVILWKYLYTRRYMMIDIYIDAESVQMLDFRGRIIKNIGYNNINAIETRIIDIDANARYNRLSEYSRHELIFIYVNEAKCFEDLRLETFSTKGSRLFVDHWEVNKYAPKSFLYDYSNTPKFWGPDIFFDDNCVAFAFDGNAWDLLHIYTRHIGNLFR